MNALEPAPTPVTGTVVAPATTGGATLHGTGALAATYAEDLLLGTVRDTHLAIASRVWGLANPLTAGAAKPSQVVHDRIAGTIYASLGAGLRTGAKVLEKQERRGRGRRTEDLRFGRHVTSVVNGLIGDRLIQDGNSGAIRMAVRHDGRDVPLTPDALAAAYPRATGQVILFVHGLMEHDEHWDKRADELPWYGVPLAAQGWSPLRLRVNSGLSIAENGVALAALLDQLLEAWPVPVERIALVGHSMGGLIIRRACVVDTGHAEPWRERVTDVVFLGTPHLGAPLERLANFGAKALGVLPESRSFGRILETRSVGISDLRNGVRDEVARLPHASYHLVSATLGPTVFHPLSVAFGDLLVRHPSAMGRSGRVDLFPGASTLHLPNTDHFGLLNHPEVHRKLKEWLG
ncbi:hypothetical protein GCM10011584_13950 [Nocardioides phosphati]|uniref:GPI inositol-deacylase PGAP1-like alpha/beta domain-containing protein n=1 Tax=Nocardioides phosphati TaxID=1867775 RepID=A0ABQ2N9U1_9ACTN|nr:alpha/beta hydrolase [Nocardioides phosphati]GGO87995.1 hypothetical protein GCM10011584_13950 [Nocardioides phosphati]